VVVVVAAQALLDRKTPTKRAATAARVVVQASLALQQLGPVVVAAVFSAVPSGRLELVVLVVAAMGGKAQQTVLAELQTLVVVAVVAAPHLPAQVERALSL
jgi:hypothetical protein